MLQTKPNFSSAMRTGGANLQPHNTSEMKTELVNIAREAAMAAGSIQMEQFGKDGQCILDNPSHDLKIAMDRASEDAICSILHREFPDHAILSEEGGWIERGSDYTWIIDPLDGTLNYFHGVPFFCTSVACYHLPQPHQEKEPVAGISLVRHGQPLVSVVYAPYFNWMFSATTGGGAMCNDQPIHNSNKAALTDAVVSVSYGSHETVIQHMENVAAELLRRTKKVRMFGSSALELAQLARGAAMGLVQLNIQIWDFAAASLILSESGVCFEARPNRMNGWQILAAPENLFDPLKSILTSILPRDFWLSD
jgi:fructose-1,6-bisphosphatase/inositol monophosphatase family enzyme